MPSARTALAVALVTVALALQVTLFSRLPLPGATPDVLLLVVVALALAYGPGFGLVCGFAAGLAADLVPPADHEVGRWALVLTLVGYLAGLGRDSSRRSAFVPLVVVAVAGGGAVLLYAGSRCPDGRPEHLLGRRPLRAAHRDPLRRGAQRVRRPRRPRARPPGRTRAAGVHMSEKSRLRLIVLQVLVLSLLVTLLGRLWYVQVVAAENYKTAAAENGTREIITPAARGMILDSRGRPLARNRTALVVSISRTALLRQPDGGRALVAKVAAVIGEPADDVWEKTRLCGSPGAPPAPRCFNGSPYQPIPVTDEASTEMALQIMERREDFPGVTAELTAVREYPQPLGANAAHVLGYLGPVTDDELAAREQENSRRGAKNETVLQRTDLIGRTGLEAEYDDVLRGTPGVKTLAVDHEGGVSGVLAETQPTAGQPPRHDHRREGAGRGREAAEGRDQARPEHR